MLRFYKKKNKQKQTKACVPHVVVFSDLLGIPESTLQKLGFADSQKRWDFLIQL